MTLRTRDGRLRELMDDPDCDPQRLAATLRRFDVVNRVVGGWGLVWERHLGPALRGLDRPARVLDVGSGGGDVVTRLAVRAEKEGLDVSWLGIDPDERALGVARERARPNVAFAATDAAGMLATGERFDAVISNHVLHHLTAEQLPTFAAATLALSTGPVFHADIERSRIAYALYGIGITVVQAGTFLRTDGLRSIRRSYRPDELQHALGDPWQVIRPAPFRVLAIGSGRA